MLLVLWQKRHTISVNVQLQKYLFSVSPSDSFTIIIIQAVSLQSSYKRFLYNHHTRGSLTIIIIQKTKKWRQSKRMRKWMTFYFWIHTGEEFWQEQDAGHPFWRIYILYTLDEYLTIEAVKYSSLLDCCCPRNRCCRRHDDWNGLGWQVIDVVKNSVPRDDT